MEGTGGKLGVSDYLIGHRARRVAEDLRIVGMASIGSQFLRDNFGAPLSDPATMKKLTGALVLGVFGSTCLLAWAMLALMLDIKSAGRTLPYFTDCCIVLRPVLILLPMVATAYYLWLCLRKEDKPGRWMGFVGVTMTALIVLVLPAISTSYLLMIAPVRMAVGAH